VFKLTGKRALVTGASGGIGSAVARALHAGGAAVALSGTRTEALEALAAELAERAHVVAADLTDPTAVEGLVGAAESLLGGLDVLVNNAGLSRDALGVRIKDDDWKMVLDVNITAPFRLVRAALRGMMKQRWGRIVNMASVVAVAGNPGQASYAAAKAGVIGMSKSLAREVASRGITVNCVAPGFVESPMTDSLSEVQRRQLADGIPSGRFGTAADVAACVVFLASEEAAYITGQTLHVNGGMVMI